MKTYRIPIIWQEIKEFEIEADNLQSALYQALKQFLESSSEGYIEDSFEVDGIIEDNYPDEEYNLNVILESI